MKRKVTKNDGVDEIVNRLGKGPDCVVKSYQGYDINGYTFYTSDQDMVKTKLAPTGGEKRAGSSCQCCKQKCARLRRSGWVGFKERKENIWAQLVAKYPDLKDITNSRAKWFLMGHAKEIKETKEYELTDFVIEIGADLFRVEQEMKADGSYSQNKEDPLVRVVGPEHGGCSRTVSHLIGKTKVHGGLFKNVNHDTESNARLETMRHGSSYGSDARVEYPPIELAPEMESSHGSQSRRVDSPLMQDEENSFHSVYIPDMNALNGESEEMDMHDVNNELVATIGGHLSDLVSIQDFFI
ncbi:hypothetical protein QVD17_24725 [Tagetes erecta]|uniref:Uncharacterized protein n=1 Tax=Tagetes erecta TaxID=13708 RepID=A0AAD8KFQ1_TARER|nr:hypothetical protein QVD17_24725 [Tagetes erecta]